MSKHTPGPWKWNDGQPKGYDLCWLDGADGTRIMTMYGGEDVSPNQHLIAAAPDLYAYVSKTAEWLRKRIAYSRQMAAANRGRFDSLADACEHDAKNYQIQLNEAEACLAKAGGQR